MNEKRNDRQQGGAGRDGGMNREKKDQQPDRTRTGQAGEGERREDTARQGQRGAQKGGIGQQKPAPNLEEDVE